VIGSWTGMLDKDRAEQVLSGKEPFDEAAFAAGDAHGGGAYDEDAFDDAPAVSERELAQIGH
jgi:aerobic C4-dicarboxylate transport protein